MAPEVIACDENLGATYDNRVCITMLFLENNFLFDVKMALSFSYSFGLKIVFLCFSLNFFLMYTVGAIRNCSHKVTKVTAK